LFAALRSDMIDFVAPLLPLRDALLALHLNWRGA
jgi:hypothetical protein